MGISTRHVVMVGIEVEPDKKLSKRYPDKKYIENDDLAYFEDNYNTEWAIFGKILEISADDRWEPAYLKFAKRTLKKEDQDLVTARLEDEGYNVEILPGLYVFTHLS